MINWIIRPETNEEKNYRIKMYPKNYVEFRKGIEMMKIKQRKAQKRKVMGLKPR